MVLSGKISGFILCMLIIFVSGMMIYAIEFLNTKFDQPQHEEIYVEYKCFEPDMDKSVDFEIKTWDQFSFDKILVDNLTALTMSCIKSNSEPKNFSDKDFVEPCFKTVYNISCPKRWMYSYSKDENKSGLWRLCSTATTDKYHNAKIACLRSGWRQKATIQPTSKIIKKTF